MLKEYNEGKRADRQIKDYLKYVSDSKKNDVAAEIILQIGDKEFWGQKTIEEWKTMKPLLKEQLEAFKAAVPKFKVASAVIHFDESSPHMQVIGVPVATGYHRGMKKQVAKTKVFTKERMEQIQDIIHEQAESLIQEHPEIFGEETLKPKEKGRNNDMSKEFYIRMKQKQYEEISEEITKLEVERDNLVEVKNEIAEATNKIVDEAVEKIVDTKMKKEFLRYALLDEPKSSLGKLVSGTFRRFKECWEKNRKTFAIEETKESVLAKLKSISQRKGDIQNNSENIKKRHRYEIDR